MTSTYVCTDCPYSCKLTTESRQPTRCVYESWPVKWRIESEDETRAREQADALKYLDLGNRNQSRKTGE